MPIISKKDLLQSKKGLLQLRGMLEQKRSALGKQMRGMNKASKSQEAPAWVEDVMQEYARGFHPEKPASYYRVLRILRRHKIL